MQLLCRSYEGVVWTSSSRSQSSGPPVHVPASWGHRPAAAMMDLQPHQLGPSPAATCRSWPLYSILDHPRGYPWWYEEYDTPDLGKLPGKTSLYMSWLPIGHYWTLHVEERKTQSQLHEYSYDHTYPVWVTSQWSDGLVYWMEYLHTQCHTQVTIPTSSMLCLPRSGSCDLLGDGWVILLCRAAPTGT